MWIYAIACVIFEFIKQMSLFLDLFSLKALSFIYSTFLENGVINYLLGCKRERAIPLSL